MVELNMRLFNIALAITALSTVTPVSNALYPEEIPQECRHASKIAQEDGMYFNYWLKTNICRRDFKVSFDQVKDYIDPVVHRYLSFVWSQLNPPLSLEEDVLPFYQSIKNDCVLNPEWGVIDIQNFCDISNKDERLSNIVNKCIIPKVAMRYISQLPELIDWAKKHCIEERDLIEDILIKTRCKTPNANLGVLNSRPGYMKS